MIRAAVGGLGTIGSHVARLLLTNRGGIELVGVASKDPGQIGRVVGDVLGSGVPGPEIGGSVEELMACGPDVVVLATGSFLADVADDLLLCARRGVSVVSPCEELAYPFTRDPGWATFIDAEARSGGAAILGSGVNPGFIFDTLLAAASGVCWDVQAIRGKRIVDTSAFGRNIHRRLGIGYTSEEFEAGHDDGSIAGHVGFPESIQIVCERLGLVLDGVPEEIFEPVFADGTVRTSYGEIRAGQTEGFVQRAIGRVKGEPIIQLELVLHLRPTAVGLEPVDTIEIDGLQPVRLTLRPGMDAVLATSAQLVNSIPALLRSPPGLRTVKDLPVSAAWLGLPEGLLR